MKYEHFIHQKHRHTADSGFEVPQGEFCGMLFPFQREVVAWALRRGKACIFADCGLGKTAMMLQWAHCVYSHTGGKVLIIAPLAVASQTVAEGEKFGLPCRYSRDGVIRDSDRVVITNYEMLHSFRLRDFQGVVLDESSILKSYSGKVRNEIIDSTACVPYRLACTATPAPNDYMELGNHSEFCGVRSRQEMLATYFVHDGGETSKWRLKGHAEKDFWQWVSTWACVMRKPSDIGFDDTGFTLPKLIIRTQFVPSHAPEGMLFCKVANTLAERRQSRRDSLETRVKTVAEIANASDEQFLIWCDFNRESELLWRTIRGAVEVKGADSVTHKENAMLGFSRGDVRVLVTKPSIAGFGMNWQNCRNILFCGMSDSYEQFYQAVRRCWRFGQKHPVRVTIVISESEQAVVDNIQRKERDFQKMQAGVATATAESVSSAWRQHHRNEKYAPQMAMQIQNFNEEN